MERRLHYISCQHCCYFVANPSTPRSNSNFKVYVVMPLLPAFEGEFGTNSGAALQAVTHWNYSSICRGGFSLMEKLAQEVPDPNKYIVFCGLRSWDRLDGKLVCVITFIFRELFCLYQFSSSHHSYS